MESTTSKDQFCDISDFFRDDYLKSLRSYFISMKIIITGANGMLGSSLCRLYQQSDEVYALHRDKECYTLCTTDFSISLMNRSKVQRVFDRIEPNLVIHCAGLTNVDQCEKAPDLAYDSNVVITENIANACTETRLVYISTDQVYGEAADHSETNKNLQPVNRYGETKYQGEQKAVEHCPDCTIIRTNIFGWNVKPRKVSSAEWIYKSLKNGNEITLFYDYTFSPIYTVYLGKIIMQLVELDFTGMINIGSPSPCSKFDFGIKLAEEFGFDKLLVKKGSIEVHNFLAKRVALLDMDCSQLAGMHVDVPEWEQSLRAFAEDNSLV